MNKSNAHRLYSLAIGLMSNPVELPEIFSEAGVKHVLDTIVSPARNKFRDECPSVSMFPVKFHQ